MNEEQAKRFLTVLVSRTENVDWSQICVTEMKEGRQNDERYQVAV